MAGIAAGAALTPLNTTMLAVALPGIMDEFGLGAAEVSSLVTLYLGAVALSLPIGGSLGDRFGHRTVFLVGVAGFASASLAAALASEFVLLEAARVVQAASGALVSTSSTAIVRRAAPPGRSGEAFGIFDLLVSTSAAAGPFLGGLLVAAFGWRSVFTLALPLGVLAAAVVAVLLRGDSTADRADPARIDVPGLAILALAIACVVVAARTGASGVGALALIALGPVLAVFVAFELRRPHPAIDPRLFRAPAFAAAVVGIFGTTIVLHGTFFMVPILVEGGLGGSALDSGLVLLGVAGVSAVIAPFGGRASDRIGRRALVVAGTLVIAVGAAGLAVVAAAPSLVLIGALLAVLGLGFGLAGAPRQAAAFDALPEDRLGMGAGTYYTGRYLGGVVGASLGGAVLGASTGGDGGFVLGFGILAAVAAVAAVTALAMPDARRAAPATRRA